MHERQYEVRRPDRLEIVVALLLGWGSNILALMVVDWLFDEVYIGRWGGLLIGAAVLGVGNAVIRPLLALLTLPLIIFTLGLAYFAISVAMLGLAEWIAPDFSIEGLWTYVGATIVVSIVNFALGLLLGTRRKGKTRIERMR